MVITWEEPPPPQNRRNQTRWETVVAELAQHPGKWALVHEDFLIGNRVNLSRRYPMCEWTTRGGTSSNYGRLYARWIGHTERQAA